MCSLTSRTNKQYWNSGDKFPWTAAEKPWTEAEQLWTAAEQPWTAGEQPWMAGEQPWTEPEQIAGRQLNNQLGLIIGEEKL